MKRPCVIIHWEDCSTHNKGWAEVSEIKAWAKTYVGAEMVSCGTLLEKTKKHIIITPLYNPDDDWAGIHVRIPMGCVTKFVYVKG